MKYRMRMGGYARYLADVGNTISYDMRGSRYLRYFLFFL